MLTFISCLACRVVSAVLKKLGRGATSLPGVVALKFKGDILKVLSRNVKVILVTGTNGKTTSCRILEEALIESNKSYFINKSGANLITGITTSFIMNSTIFGKAKKEYAIVECDENAFKKVSLYLEPKVILVTNVFRDQLDRYGEVTHTLGAIKESVKNIPNAVVCLNADCSLTYSMSREIPNKIVTFGVNVPFYEEKNQREISDSKYCIFCKSPYEYTYTTYAHLGDFHCTNCGYHRVSPEFAVEQIVEMKQNSSTVVADIQGDRNIVKINIGGTYNIYNAIGCVAALTYFGIEVPVILKSLENFNGAFGRMESFKNNGVDIDVILVKNPAGFSQVLSFLSHESEPCNVIFCLNDNAADGKDISWIWDVDFSPISKKDNINHIYVSGKRSYDMALRLKYDDINTDKITVMSGEDYKELTQIISRLKEKVYVVPTYTSMMALRPYMAKKFGGKEFWK